MFQNNETAAMLVFQTSPVRVELFSYVNTFFFPISHRTRTTKETIQPNNKGPRGTLLFGSFVYFVMTVLAERPTSPVPLLLILDRFTPP